MARRRSPIVPPARDDRPIPRAPGLIYSCGTGAAGGHMGARRSGGGMGRGRGRRRGATRGQSAVEFALVSLVFLALTFGALDLGRGVFVRAMLSNAARESSRYASINP